MAGHKESHGRREWLVEEASVRHFQEVRARWAADLSLFLGVTVEEVMLLQAWAAQKPEVRRCWVYGSRAGSDHRGRTYRPESDIDIALEIECDPSDEDYIGLTYRIWPDWVKELEALLPYPVHLVELREEKPVTEAIAAGRGVLLVFERGN